MFLIYGRGKARIKRFREDQLSCERCGLFDIEVSVYREYYHLFFIPVFPFGPKTLVAKCKHCVTPQRLELSRSAHEKPIRTPFYLFSLPIIVLGLIAAGTISGILAKNRDARYIKTPRVGDVYHIKSVESSPVNYYFLRVSQIKQDTVYTYHNEFFYSAPVSRFDDDDFFHTDEEVIFTKQELGEMLSRGKISSVDRDYDDSEGFDRVN